MSLAGIFFRIYSWLRYKIKAQNLHGLHSPFVYQLYKLIIRPDKYYSVFEPIEALRSQTLLSKEILLTQDFGAGALITQHTRKRVVGDMVASSSKPARQARLLFGLAQHFSPKHTIELGTHLGFTTSYLAKAHTDGQILYSFEGCKQTSDLAGKHLKTLGIENVNIVEGNIDHTLKLHIDTIDCVDMVFFDANHTKKATINYFETCLPKTNEDTIFIFDDIYWSSDMADAWAYICAHPKTRQTIDIYQMGFVFFRHSQPKQHFILQW